MSKWEEKQVRPVLPRYLAAGTWPVASLVFPPYKLANLILVAVCSVVVYGAARYFCPMRVVRKLVPYATGSEDVDAMLNGIASNLDALHTLNDAIPDAQGCNVRYGIAPDKLYHSHLVYGQNEVTLCTLTAGQAVYIAVDAFNENGVTPGEVFKL